eukprot:5151272-Lingulodinium_polyedra.AAC.1
MYPQNQVPSPCSGESARLEPPVAQFHFLPQQGDAQHPSCVVLPCLERCERRQKWQLLSDVRLQ